MFGGPHQRDEVKRTEQLGWSTKTERRLRQGARCTKCCLGPERVYTQESKNLTESLLTRPTSLAMSPDLSVSLCYAASRSWVSKCTGTLRRSQTMPNHERIFRV